ncbi:MAG: clostripain-related cysteine peptidase [Thiolinea sp.]
MVIKRYLLLLLTSLLIIACNDDTDTDELTRAGTPGYSDSPGVLTEYEAPAAIDGAGKKLFAIYMVGSDLEDQGLSGTKDFLELIKGYNKLTAAEKNSVDIVVAFGGSTNWPGMRIANMGQILQDWNEENLVIADELDNLNYEDSYESSFNKLLNAFGDMGADNYLYYAPKAHMGDESSLKLFLKYLTDGYSTHDGKFLDMWDHGAAYGLFGNDSNYNSDGLTLKETTTAFDSTDLTFDIIGYDACLNANIELASAIHGHARYLLASEETEPGHGWDYEDVIAYLIDNDDPVELTKKMIDNFVTNPEHAADGKTLSVVDMNHYDALFNAITQFANAVSAQVLDSETKQILAKVHQGNTNLVEGYGKSKNLPVGMTYDLKGLVNVFHTESSDTTIINAAKSVLDQLEDYIVYANADKSRPHAHGVTIAPILAFRDDGSIKDEQIPNQAYLSLMTDVYNNLVLNDNSAPTTQFARPGSRPVFANRAEMDSLFMARTSDDISEGTTAIFTDDNLSKVITAYANILQDEDGNDTILMLGELPAIKTQNANEYFTAKWNKKWFIVQLGDTEATETPLFLQYDGSVTDEETGETLEKFSGEIDFIKARKDYSAYPADEQFDYGRIHLKVDAENNVVSHQISPYRMMYSSAEDTVGFPQFEKYGQPLQKGDKVRMLSNAFVPATKENYWNIEGDFIEVSLNTPVFTFTELEFEDENGMLLDYYYLMRAEDFAGNIANTTPEKI